MKRFLKKNSSCAAMLKIAQSRVIGQPVQETFFCDISIPVRTSEELLIDIRNDVARSTLQSHVRFDPGFQIRLHILKDHLRRERMQAIEKKLIHVVFERMGIIDPGKFILPCEKRFPVDRIART